MAASPSLSEGEFHRMQLQLIELRTTNYELEGKNKRIERDLSDANEKLEILDKELGKAKQAINKSKKAKDVELLIQESDSLQRKLLSQEEEFRLQNQTLMEELSLLVSNNEELKKEIDNLKSGATFAPEETVQGASDELIRLQAENLALQKNLNALQDKVDKEILSKDEGQHLESDSSQTNNSAHPGYDNTDGTEDGEGLRKPVQSSPPSDQGEVIKKLCLELDTEREEKHLLKTQLDQRKKESQEQIAALQDEVEKAADKLKKKQESYLQLHAEKETLFKETNAKLEESQAARDRDQKYYKDQIAKLQVEIERGKKEIESLHVTKDKQIEELKHHLANLQTQVDTSGIVASHQLQEQSGKYLAEITVLRDNLSRTTKDRDDLYAQLQESRRVAEDAVSQMQAALAERDTQILSMQEVSKVAEKRKSLLDELAIKYQNEYDSHRQNLAAMEAKQGAENGKLQSEIEEKSRKLSELHRQVAVVEEINRKNHSLEDAKGWLERRLSEVEEQLSTTITSFDEEKESLTTQHAAHTEELITRHREAMNTCLEERGKMEEDWRQRETVLKEELEGMNNTINQLKQDIRDSEDDKKLHEKKGITMIKDLKRQLHAERKRGDKLQAKLQEVLSEDTSKSRFSNTFVLTICIKYKKVLLSHFHPGGLVQVDWAKIHCLIPQSPTSANTSHHSETSVGDEYNELLKRVGLLQQEKWSLEEKVSHLETSNACMAEDILSKTSIIEHYVMQSRTGPRASNSHDDKLSLKKVMDLVNKNSEHTQHTQDMNKKLQSMLEETLTKNMHLQQDLEFMSQEVVRLSKLSAQQTAADIPKPTRFKEATPPTSLSLTSTFTSPSPNNPAGSNERESSVTSDDNFEIVSKAQAMECDAEGSLLAENEDSSL
ncbi:unnamed protein product [Lymnaea stagnalis]|uniref:GRIP1-associated protein 1 n=1 Tax=Lymnaea stagnalis TaxID=6523 RepID=A0AAV2GYU2_LYMST